VAVYDAAKAAIKRAKDGDGPTLLVTECYRIEGHYAGEPEVYRTKEEVAEVRASSDPIPKFRSRILSEKVASEPELAKLEDEIKVEIEVAVTFALESAEPEPSLAYKYVYM